MTRTCPTCGPDCDCRARGIVCRCDMCRIEHRGGPRANSGGTRRNAGRPRLPRLTADEATALLRELAPDARTPMDYAWAVGCRPERVREALRGGCTVATAERWRWARPAPAVNELGRPDYVVCRCGWRGRRKWMSCECDCEMGACVCGPRVGHGACARCGRRGLMTPAEWKEWRANEAAVAKMVAVESYGASVEAFGVADALSTHPHLGLEEG